MRLLLNRTRSKHILFVIAAILLILLPFYVGQYTVTTFIRIIYFGFLSLSMGFLIGQGGMVSLTQTAFFGLEWIHHWSFWC